MVVTPNVYIGDPVFPSNVRIWSPPFLQGFFHWMTGTGLLPYIRPLGEG